MSQECRRMKVFFQSVRAARWYYMLASQKSFGWENIDEILEKFHCTLSPAHTLYLLLVVAFPLSS